MLIKKEVTLKKIFLFILLSGFCVFLYSQTMKEHSHSIDTDVKVKGAMHLPEGWELRFDKSNASKTDMRLVKEQDYYHFTSGPAAIYYNPKDKESSEYKVEANFIQTKPSKHPEAYGIFFAGSNLQKDNQHYLYFLVRQDGKYLIKERNGKDTKEIIKWTAHKNVNAQNKSGQTINKISVMVGKNDVNFSANDKTVITLNKKDLGNTDGIAGLRINHNLDVKATSLIVGKL